MQQATLTTYDDTAVASRIVRQFDGCYLSSYIVKGEEHLQATIGWGHAIPLKDHPLTISKATALQLLLGDLNNRRSPIKAKIPAALFNSLTSNELGATISWAFNSQGWAGSETFENLVDGNKEAFIAATSDWIRDENQSVLPELVRRRATERHLFMRNSFDEVIALNWYMGLLPLIKNLPEGKLVWTGTRCTWE